MLTEQEELVHRYMPLAESLAWKACTKWDDPDVVRADALLGLVLAAQRFKPEIGAPFPAFAVPTIRGTIARSRRDRSGLLRSQWEARDSTAWPLYLDAPHPKHDELTLGETVVSHNAEDGQAHAVWADALRRLPVQERRVVQLHHVWGLTQVEIGELVGISQMQVSRRLRSARARLREILGEDGEDGFDIARLA